MSSSKEVVGLYREFEKLFKLCTLWSGEPRQLETVLEATQASIDQAFREREEPYFFDIFSARVNHDGQPIHQTEGSSFSLSYSLFCEGVRTIIVLPSLGSQELFQWVKQIYSHLKQEEKGEPGDLATKLWKLPTTSLRVQLYSGLGLEDFGLQILELGDQVEEILVDATAARKDESVFRALSAGEGGWDLPIAEKFDLEEVAEEDRLSDSAVEDLKKDLQSIGVSEKAEKILAVSKREVEILREELSSFHLDLIEFNLLNQYLGLFPKASEELRKELEGHLVGLMTSILDRFHPGLILFLSAYLRKWAGQDWAQQVQDQFEEAIQKAFESEAKLKVLVLAAADSKKARMVKGLLEHLSEEQIPRALAISAQHGTADSRRLIFDALVRQRKLLKPQKLFSTQDSDLIRAYLPELMEEDFEGKDQFLVQLLRSPDPEISSRVAQRIDSLLIPPPAALKLYESLSMDNRGLWLKALEKPERPALWREFLIRGLEAGRWAMGSETLARSWVRALIAQLAGDCLQHLLPIVRARVFFFFPRYRNERLWILRELFSIEDPQWKEALSEIREMESSWVFQSSESQRILRGMKR
ncbi:MAG: hypothetical protein EA369_01170 [Bradymonadales bacterium]|nr:MAG: hypothetical protein EA369_01170 [Bradymonadales bacterium]